MTDQTPIRAAETDFTTEMRAAVEARAEAAQNRAPRPVMANVADAPNWRGTEPGIGAVKAPSAPQQAVAKGGAKAVADQIEKLIRKANEANKLAAMLSLGLAGADDAPVAPANTANVANEPLFVRQAAGLDAVDRVLDSSIRQLTRALASLG